VTTELRLERALRTPLKEPQSPVHRGLGAPGGVRKSALCWNNAFILPTVLAISSHRSLFYLTNNLSVVTSCLLGYITSKVKITRFLSQSVPSHLLLSMGISYGAQRNLRRRLWHRLRFWTGTCMGCLMKIQAPHSFRLTMKLGK
jgi:hypothetical protein